MELKTFDEIYAMLGKDIKCIVQNIPFEDKNIQEEIGCYILTAKLNKITAQWEYTIEGNNCLHLSAFIDIAFPEYGTYHLIAQRLFTIDMSDNEIERSELISQKEKYTKLLSDINSKLGKDKE